MSKQHIQQLVRAALQELREAGELLVEFPAFHFDDSKDKQYGDFACNIAMTLAKTANRKPRDLAEMIIKSLPVSTQIQKVEMAGPGFINFFLSPQALFSIVPEIIAEGKQF